MKNDKDLFPFENILSAYYINKNTQTQEASLDWEAKTVFGWSVDIELPKPKLEFMIQELTKTLSKDTLGSVVKEKLSANPVTETELQTKTGLTPSMLDAIKKDLVFTNSIPVRSLVKLLKFFSISVDKALAAIEATFDKLQTESKALSVPMNIQPSFRKGMVRSELGKDLGQLKSDESYLYQNKEALDKYTSRLTELYQIL